MGDRANIVFKGGHAFPAPLFMYTHWNGTELPETLRNALIKGKNRWQDGQYLARIVFCELVKSDPDGTTGFGLSTAIGDNEHPLLVVDVDAQVVRVVKGTDPDGPSQPGKGEWTFAEFTADPEGHPLLDW